MLRFVSNGCTIGAVTDQIQSGELLDTAQAHEPDLQVTDLQWSPDRTYFITASKDKTAKVGPLRGKCSADDIDHLLRLLQPETLRY